MKHPENDLYIPPELGPLDHALLRFLQADLPLISHPYRALAEEFGVDEAFIAERIHKLREQGTIRRIGAILHHRKAGYTVNALTAWNADPKGEETREEALARTGKALSAHPAVSHCYARSCPNGWEWPVFAMLHAETEEQLRANLNELMQAVRSTDMRVFRTVREWKKTSMKYF